VGLDQIIYSVEYGSNNDYIIMKELIALRKCYPIHNYMCELFDEVDNTAYYSFRKDFIDEIIRKLDLCINKGYDWESEFGPDPFDYDEAQISQLKELFEVLTSNKDSEDYMYWSWW